MCSRFQPSKALHCVDECTPGRRCKCPPGCHESGVSGPARGRGAWAGVGMVRESVLTAGAVWQACARAAQAPAAQSPNFLVCDTGDSPVFGAGVRFERGDHARKARCSAQVGPWQRAVVICTEEQSERGSPGTCIAPWDVAPSGPFSAAAVFPGQGFWELGCVTCLSCAPRR